MFKKFLKALFPSEVPGGEELGDFRGERENEVYRQRFGAAGGGTIATPSRELLESLLPGVDARFGHVGVLVYPPEGERAGHTFVTSGLSDPWEFGPGHGRSGLGFELVLTTEQPQEWPIGMLLRLMLHQLGVAMGSRKGDLFELGDRIPIRPVGITAAPPTVTGLILARNEGAGHLSTGAFDFYRLVAVTTEEYAFSIDAGTAALVQLLEAQGLIVLPSVRETIPEARRAILPDVLKAHF